MMRGQEKQIFPTQTKKEQVSTPQPRYWFPWLSGRGRALVGVGYHGAEKEKYVPFLLAHVQ
jgi:hypothetical protein